VEKKMEVPDYKKPRVGLRLLLLAGFAANMFGCALRDQHRFDETATKPPAGLSINTFGFDTLQKSNETRAAPPALNSPTVARLGPPQASSEGAPPESKFESPVVNQISHQELGELPKSGITTNAASLPMRGRPAAPGRQKDSPVQANETSGAWTFDQAISATLMADPKIRAGFELINQAKADLKTSSLFPNPTHFVQGFFLPLRPLTPDRPGGPTEFDTNIGYPIDWFLFGKRTAAMASASLGVRQSESDYADLIRQRVATTAGAFYDVVEAKALLELARKDVKNLSELATRTEKSLKEGGKPMVDLHRVRLDLLKSEQAVRESEAAVTVAKGKLRSLFGRTDPDPDFDVQGDLDAPLTAEPLEREKAYALAQENRPDIQSLRLQVSKAQADIIVERRKAFPQITPTVGYTRQFQTPLGVPDADTWSVNVTTTLPLFDRNQGNRMKSMSIASQNAFNLETALVDLRSEITQVHSDFVTAYRNTQAIGEEQLKSAQAVLDSIIKGKEFGGLRVVDVLDAERAYRETHRAYINSRANYWRAVYRFSAALGKQIGQP
jgi:cobalt-zinc-cadmium efflux system outer membrane protein